MVTICIIPRVLYNYRNTNKILITIISIAITNPGTDMTLVCRTPWHPESCRAMRQAAAAWPVQQAL